MATHADPDAAVEPGRQAGIMRIRDCSDVRLYTIVLNPKETARIRAAGLFPAATYSYGNRPHVQMLEARLSRSSIMKLREYLDCDAQTLEAMLEQAPVAP